MNSWPLYNGIGFLQLPLPETFLDFGFIFLCCNVCSLSVQLPQPEAFLDFGSIFLCCNVYALYLCAPRNFPDYGSFPPPLQIWIKWKSMVTITLGSRRAITVAGARSMMWGCWIPWVEELCREQKSHHRCRCKKHDVRMLDSLKKSVVLEVVKRLCMCCSVPSCSSYYRIACLCCSIHW